MRLNATDKLAAGRLIAARKQPYFRTALTGLIPYCAPGIGTFGVTEGMVMYYDPAKLDEWTVEQLAGVLAHEIQHPLLDHAGRQRAINADHKMFNVAGDMAINPGVLDAGHTLPGEPCMPSTIGMADGLAAEEYYSELINQQEQEQSQGSSGDEGDGSGDSDEQGENGGPGCDPGGDSGGPDSQAISDDGNASECNVETPPGDPASGDCVGAAGNPRDFEAAIDAEMGRSNREIEQTRRATAEAIKQAPATGKGSAPAGWARWADAELKPPSIPWQQKLRTLVRRASAFQAGSVQSTYTRPSRRQGAVGYGLGVPILAGSRTPVPVVTVIVDTSGSMGDGELATALSETSGVVNAVGGGINFIACDADVQASERVTDWRKVVDLMKGGGGTDMRPAFEAALEQRERPNIIICITDGQLYGYVPEEPRGCSVVWVTVGEYQQKPADWGDIVEVRP